MKLAWSFAIAGQQTQRIIYCLWLFTFSDLKTIVGPSTAFAILHKLGAQAYSSHNVATFQAVELIAQGLSAAGWAWVNLLPFVIDNQRQSIREDLINKPWRPLPSRRMTSREATILMLAFYPAAVWTSVRLGAGPQSLALVFLGVWYNDFGGAASWLARNFINACGFVCYTSGALQVMAPQGVLANGILARWFFVVGAIVFSTVQSQDMYDQAGDREQGRRTVPLIIGDGMARWTIAVPMAFWCWFCPWFWSASAGAYAVALALLGGTVAARSLCLRSVENDKTTFRLWNLWMVSLYGLPLTSSGLVV